MHLATWSSATIRNELATLSEIGYLIQPHTSAGRVPSDLGYRYYVDFLMEEEAVPAAVRRQLEPFFAALPATLEGVLEIAATALAVVTDAVSLVTAPGALGARVKHLDLVSLEPVQAPLVLHDGVRNLLHQPEFGDVDLLRHVIEVVEEQRMLAALIAQVDRDSGVQIMIGRENNLAELSRCSLVLTTYRAGPERRGTIGILGSTRMPYGHVAPRVRDVAARVGHALERVLS